MELPCLLSYSYGLPLMVAKVKHQREGMTRARKAHHMRH